MAITPMVRSTNRRCGSSEFGGVRAQRTRRTDRGARPGVVGRIPVHSEGVPTSDALGADPEALERLAVAMRAGGASLDGADVRLRRRLASVAWSGPDARYLQTAFDAGVRRELDRAGGELRSLADRLESQALEQRQASGDAQAGPGERVGEVRTAPSVGGHAGAAGGETTPLNVLTETHTLGVEAGASPVDARAEATLTLTVLDDGSAKVRVHTDQRIGALLGEAGAGAGVGLTGSNEVMVSFADEATARSFVTQMSDALMPDGDALADMGAPPRWAVAAGLALPAVLVGGGKAIVDDVSSDAAGVLIAHQPTAIDGSAGGSLDTWATGAVDRFGIDAEIARGAAYHPTTDTWVTSTTVSAGATAQAIGDLGIDLSGESTISTTIGADGITEGTWSVETTGAGAAALFGGLGIGTGAPAVDPGGDEVVRFEATLAADDAQTRAALNEFNQGHPAPHRAVATLGRMVREGELTITVERSEVSDLGRSYGPIRVISDHGVTRTQTASRRSPGGPWRRVR